MFLEGKLELQPATEEGTENGKEMGTPKIRERCDVTQFRTNNQRLLPILRLLSSKNLKNYSSKSGCKICPNLPDCIFLMPTFFWRNHDAGKMSGMYVTM